MLRKIQERNEQLERMERERAGLIAATMCNAWLRGKHDPPVEPMDFWRTIEDDRMEPEEALQFMRAWAEARNQKVH